MRPSCSATRSRFGARIPRPVVLEDDLDRRRPVGPGVGVARACEEVAELAGAQPERCPRVAELDRAPERAGGAAADPDRDAGRGPRAARRAGRRNAKYSPAYSGRACDSAARERAERVVGPRPAVGERRAEERELLLERPAADAEDQAPAAHDVERAVALRDRQRVVVAEHEHERRELDPVRDRAAR